MAGNSNPYAAIHGDARKLKFDNNSEAQLNSQRIYVNYSFRPNFKNSTHVSNCSKVSCRCVKVSNGLRCLKMHQRSCRVRKGLEKESYDSVNVNEIYDDTGHIEHQINSNSIPAIKPGIKLPISDYEWKLANDFLIISLPVSDVV